LRPLEAVLDPPLDHVAEGPIEVLHPRHVEPLADSVLADLQLHVQPPRLALVLGRQGCVPPATMTVLEGAPPPAALEEWFSHGPLYRGKPFVLTGRNGRTFGGSHSPRA